MAKKDNYDPESVSDAIAKRPGKPFRLEQNIYLSGTDQYNDAYKIDLAAFKIRDRFIVSAQLISEATQSRLWQNQWLFKKMERAWDKFHIINDIVVDVRDFIENEGLKNVVFLPMLKHALSGISADIENIYEKNIPTVKNAIDESTRGNLFKNQPTVPFRTQIGPDSLKDVYESTGTAENPIPEDGITSPDGYALDQKTRKDERLKDVIPSPQSNFRKALEDAGILQRLAQVNNNSSVSEKSRFLNEIHSKSQAASNHGKKKALMHYQVLTGAGIEEAEAFYSGIKALCSQTVIAVDIDFDDFVEFIYDEKLRVKEPEGYNKLAQSRNKLEQLTGCSEFKPIHGYVGFYPGMTQKISLILKDIGKDCVFIPNAAFLSSMEHEYFELNAGLAMYDYEYMQDAKAISIIMSMGRNDFAGGPALAIEKIMEPGREFGKCTCLVFKDIKLENIVEIVANRDLSIKCRKVLLKANKLVPVQMSTSNPLYIEFGETSIPNIDAQYNQQYFSLGDTIETKAIAQEKEAKGKVTKLDFDKITVQWDNGENTEFTLTEAMARFSPVGHHEEKKDDVEIEGISQDAIRVLDYYGVDATLFNSYLAANLHPIFDLNKAMDCLSKFGLDGKLTTGFIPTEDGFSNAEWIQVNLPDGHKMVVLMKDGKSTVEIANDDNFIESIPVSKVEIE